MKKIVLVLAVLMFLPIRVQAETYLDALPALDSDNSTDISCSGASVVYSKSFKFGRGVYFGTSYKSLSELSTPDIKIELEQSFQRPTTEYVSDVTYVEAEDASDIETNLTTETWHHARLSPVPSLFGRYKITGNAGNATDSQVYIYTTKQQFN